MKEVNHYHSKSIESLFEEFRTSEKGLSEEESKKRIMQNGLNQITEKKEKPWIFKLLKQFHSPLIYVLFCAMIISFIFHHTTDAYVILVVVIINAVIGFIQERKAERAINALKKMVISYAKVYRNKEVIKVPSSRLVPGDIILLEEGDKVPADARLTEVDNFRTQESSLTGESLPQEKNIKLLPEKLTIGDRTNMVFMGTIVVSGEAKALVVATANKTQIGQVAKSIQEIAQPKMHFNKKISQLTLQMGIFAISGALLTFIIGFFVRGLEFFEIFLFTIASLVSGIPEGLPAVLVIVLAIGARRMAKRNAIIRHLPAVETLGVATVIATDKTGTITQNSMTIEDIITPDGNFSVTGNGWEPLGKFYQGKNVVNPLSIPILQKILNLSSLCNRGNIVRKNGDYEIVGDPTEVALLVLGKKAGLEKDEIHDKVVDDLPFNSDLKFRATLIKTKSDGKTLLSAGAFEKLIEKSSYVQKNNRKIRFDKDMKKSFLEDAEKLAKKGMRVLGLAYKKVQPEINSVSKDLVDDLVFLGLVGMKDPPRKEIKDAISKARNAGIRVIMKTGDHKETAFAIAKEIGLANENDRVLTEEDLREMDKYQFADAVEKVNVFARITPKMKAKIVKVLQDQGEIVAMTGDGVNDAPALKGADIGISMGIIGTDVARESSEMILADDNFASIVNAIEEGRIAFQNVRRTSFYLVTTNVAEDITIISSLAIGLPLPMIPIQLLYLNLVTDTFNGVALAMEPGHTDVLSQPPRNKNEKILNRELIPFLLLMASLMALGTIPLFKYFLHQGIDKARTVAFSTMVMFQLFNAFNMKALRHSLFKVGLFSNKWLCWALLVSFGGLLAVIYIPGLANVFQFVALSWKEFGIVALISSSIFVLGEVYKFIRYRKYQNNH